MPRERWLWWSRQERQRRTALLLSIASVLIYGCAAPLFYFYETELPPVMVGEKPDYETRIVPKERAPIPPVKFGNWFMPSGWAAKLAARWADLPCVFEAGCPEYCAALGVDRDRMLHASAAVRYRDPYKAAKSCPGLIWSGDTFMVALSIAHGHQTLDHHGERISVQDATLGGPVLVGTGLNARIEMLRAAVHFSSGERLRGIDPATGKEASVPAQSLLFTRFNGATHVFMWVPLATEETGKSNFVRVYRPAPNDDWDEVGTCWVEASDVQEAFAFGAHPAVRCKPADFWLK